MKKTQRTLVAVALLNLVFPLNVWPANPLPGPLRVSSDIALTQKRVLIGKLVDSIGAPVNSLNVSIHSQGKLIADTTTDEQGFFSMVASHGGVYELRAGDQVQIVRLWHHDAAPPHAESTLQLTVNTATVRGQRPIESLACFKPWFLGALLAAAIAIPLAVDNSDSRPDGS